MLIVLVLLVLFNLSFGQLKDAVNHPKFISALPVIKDLGLRVDYTKGTNGTEQVNMVQIDNWDLGLVDVNDDSLTTDVWGYQFPGLPATYPGATIVAKKNKDVDILWNNALPTTHLLPVDNTLHMAKPDDGGITTVTHLHGGHTESASDGLPEAWFTQGFGDTGPFWVKETYHYDNDQEAATLWYHDHALGITRLNVYAGLAGFYLLRDDNENKLINNNTIPGGDYEIEIVIQDRQFDANGQLFMPSGYEPEVDELPSPPFAESKPIETFPGGPSILAEFFGDYILVNGKAWPYLEVEPRKYRFRLLNGSDSRFYILQFGSQSKEFFQIGTDNGLLPRPVTLTRLLIAPGERADLVVDFTGMAQNTSVVLQNYGPADEPFKGFNPDGTLSDGGGGVLPNAFGSGHPTGQIMEFIVNKPFNSAISNAKIKEQTRLRQNIKPLEQKGATRQLVLFEGLDEYGRLQPLLGTLADGSLGWFEQITENPMVKDVEVWEVYNATEDAHPIHLHLVSFQIINRESFTGTVEEKIQPQHNGTEGVGGVLTVSALGNDARGPEANEDGWKDTAVMLPGEVTRVIAKFDREGRYVWHCHILSHEDHEMMRPFYVGTMTASANQLIAQDQTANTNVSDIITPEKFALDANFPNPFNPITNIRFQLPEAGNVELKIFNTLGQEIITLASGSYEAGVHNVVWNARDRYGSQVPSGLYVYRLTAGNFVQERKMMLLK